MILITELSLIVISVILIIHSKKYLGRELSWLFWLSGGILGFFREWLISIYLPLYTYGDFHLTLLGIPLIMVVFWSNFFYVAMIWTDNIMGEGFIHLKENQQTAYQFIFAIMISISFLVETYASQFSMVHWLKEPPLKLWGGTPVIAPFGYGILGLLFLLTFRLFTKKTKGVNRVILMILSIPFIVLAQIGLLFLIKNTLNFIS